MSITISFADGSRRKLKMAAELGKIDSTRKARFVMDDLKVFRGYCDGKVHDDGTITIRKDWFDINVPFSHLLGWCYVVARKSGSGNPRNPKNPRR